MSYLANVSQLITSIYVGLLFVRSHAISGRKRIVLVALGLLGGCTIILSLVRSHVNVMLEPG